jgi:hypothetical protein
MWCGYLDVMASAPPPSSSFFFGVSCVGGLEEGAHGKGADKIKSGFRDAIALVRAQAAR